MACTHRGVRLTSAPPSGMTGMAPDHLRTVRRAGSTPALSTFPLPGPSGKWGLAKGTSWPSPIRQRHGPQTPASEGSTPSASTSIDGMPMQCPGGAGVHALPRRSPCPASPKAEAARSKRVQVSVRVARGVLPRGPDQPECGGDRPPRADDETVSLPAPRGRASPLRRRVGLRTADRPVRLRGGAPWLTCSFGSLTPSNNHVTVA